MDQEIPEGVTQCTFPGCDFRDSLVVLNQHIIDAHSLQLLQMITRLQTELQFERQKVATLEDRFEELIGFLRESGLNPAPRDSSSHVLNTLQRSVDKLETSCDRIGFDINVQYSLMGKCSDQMRDVKEVLKRNTTRLEEIEFKQDEMESKMNNGVFVWRITDFEQRYYDGSRGTTPTLRSRPFYTGPHGYRMCLWAYFGGDGSGKGTHISVFFMLMRSENDIFLRWPFAQAVTLTLINRNPSKSISKTLHPDSTVSFMRPRTEDNLASGFPRFAPLSALGEPGFVDDDTMLITMQTHPEGTPLAD